MADRKILIDGEEYISSGRAAELVGYSKDYVGQLARAGKIDAKRVGRNWYIREASINRHKLSVHYTLTKPKKVDAESNDVEDNDVEEVAFSIDTSQKPEHAYKGETAEGHEHKIEMNHRFVVPKDDTGDQAINIWQQRVQSKKVYHDKVKPYAIDQDRDERKDLFPQVSKHKLRDKDILIQSDIRYEKIPANSTGIRGQTEPYDPEAFRSVAVRKPIFSRSSAVSRIENTKRTAVHPQDTTRAPVRRNVSNEHISVDGVVIPNKRATSSHGSTVPTRERLEFEKELSKRRASVHAHRNSYYDNENTYDYEENEPVEKGELSKAVPVVGAIILFTVAVVVYIIITA